MTESENAFGESDTRSPHTGGVIGNNLSVVVGPMYASVKATERNGAAG